MTLSPVVIRTADAMDEDQELAADLLAAYGANGTGDAKAQLMKLLFGAIGTGTMVSTTSPLPTRDYGTITGRAQRKTDIASGQVESVSPDDLTYAGPRVLSNPSPVDMYVGHTSAVTSSGATMGHLLAASGANGTWTVPESYKGIVYCRAAVGSGGYVIVTEI